MKNTEISYNKMLKLGLSEEIIKLRYRQGFLTQEECIAQIICLRANLKVNKCK